MRIALTLTIFGTMLALVVLRPKRWHEAWWTVLGAGAMLGLGFVSPHQALEANLAGVGALLFLLALLLLSLFVGKSGFFEWAAIQSARVAKGNARALYRNAFLLGALVTATLSLDTTAVILTPVTLALVKRLRLPAAPYIVLCAFVANIGSLLLPISNLTNILFVSAFNLTFAGFAARMLAPQAVALLTTYAILRRYFRNELPESFADDALPQPFSVVPHRGYFLACVSVLSLVLVGYFAAPLLGLPAYAVAFAGAAALLVAGLLSGQVRVTALGELSWGLLPFVVGLFVAVRGLENLGVVLVAARWLTRQTFGWCTPLLVAGTTALAANISNNLPAALLARSVLLASRAPNSAVFSALLGADAGCIVTPFGSLATMLVLTIARQHGSELRFGRIMRLAAWVTPVVILATTLVLVASFAVVP